ncbi:DUF1488 domain-containing protein [Rhizobium sp. P44RR-XXIV]|uniref:DUF1488 domain-containing protein n=1 Tax=Rhizobium sp. P44RR-XXIV TaxID=1921145 RepID=UPI00098620BA|nr:DUF1488 domain-containing protein [Rhizobium sp. P44RR-XXIV]TIX89815.1 DUF1488 domain-containing protein [Rhizobium sp. P44RR-XXIV]
MGLSFPNRSRSYDASARRIRFTGHDGMFEVSFLVDADVFPGSNTEAGYLAAFDNGREAIQKVAAKAYGHARRRLYVLTSSDFR